MWLFSSLINTCAIKNEPQSFSTDKFASLSCLALLLVKPSLRKYEEKTLFQHVHMYLFNFHFSTWKVSNECQHYFTNELSHLDVSSTTWPTCSKALTVYVNGINTVQAKFQNSVEDEELLNAQRMYVPVWWIFYTNSWFSLFKVSMSLTLNVPPSISAMLVKQLCWFIEYFTFDVMQQKV